MARTLFLMIVTLLILGSLWFLVTRFEISQLPGNFDFKVGGSIVTVPILSCVIASILLSLLFRFMRRF